MADGALDEDRYVVREEDEPLAAAVGLPDPDVLERAAEVPGVCDLLAACEVADAIALPGFAREDAILFVRPDGLAWPGAAARLLEPHESLAHLPRALANEIEEAREDGPVSAAWDGGLPVAFCYAASITETLWDVSIDTWEPCRRRGHARAAVSFLAQHLLQTRGLRPVWGAAVGNAGSLGLARSLGFTAVDRLAVFSRRVGGVREAAGTPLA